MNIVISQEKNNHDTSDHESDVHKDTHHPPIQESDEHNNFHHFSNNGSIEIKINKLNNVLVNKNKDNDNEHFSYLLSKL